MNCCNEYGQCKGGKGCPVGDDLAIDMIEDPRDGVAMGMELVDWLYLVVIIVLLLLVGFGVGRWTA